MSRGLEELAAAVAATLAARGETVAVAESAAGGLVSAALLAVPGASRYFRGGVVVYTVAARQALLGVTARDMAGIRPATEPYAVLLAARSRTLLDTTWAVAETGAAGPEGNRYGDPPGHACLAVTGPVERSLTLSTGSEAREANMAAFAAAALRLLLEAIPAGPAGPAG